MSHYETLGLKREDKPTSAEIKKAYKRMAKKHHPDRGGDGKMMVLANQAYDTLMDPAKREHYDLTGEEKPLSSIDIEARNSILQLFGSLISEGKINIPRRAVAINNQAAAKMRGELAHLKSELAEIEKRRDELTVTDGTNLWHNLIDSMIEQGRGKLASQEHKLAISKRVGEMLQAYRSGVTDSAHPPAMGFGDAAATLRAMKEAMRQSGF